MARWGFLFDQGQCIGCNACQMACKDKHNLEKGQFFRRVATIEMGQDGEIYCENYSGACNHCKDAACVKSCPTGAMHYTEYGTVTADAGKCVGCGRCVGSCPYGAVSLSYKKGIAEKCDACIDLREQGKNPVCVDACITHCLEYVDLDTVTTVDGREIVRELPYLPDASAIDPVIGIIPKRRIDVCDSNTGCQTGKAFRVNGSYENKKGIKKHCTEELVRSRLSGRLQKDETAIFDAFLTCAAFFMNRNYGIQLLEHADDWSKYGRDAWESEYDALICGTDADYKIPLWASVAMGEKVLLNQTTLEVIHEYHHWGYMPIRMDGNPPDYIGEQFRFLAYLTAAIIYEENHREDLAYEQHIAALESARDSFILSYTLDNMRAILQAAQACGSYKGYIELFNRWMYFLADEQYFAGRLMLLLDFRDEELEQVKKSGRSPVIEDEEPKVILTAGLNNCGGICVIRPTVADGCMLKIESDCSSNQPQIRACVRGRGYRKTFLSPDRLRYPMKRVGERGSSRFKRISWKEAIDILYENWTRIRRNYGPGSTYMMYGTGVSSVMRPKSMMGRLLSMDGGYLDYFNSYSSACVSYMMPYVFGKDADGNSAADMLNTELLILWGHNPAETIFGPERNYYLSELKKKGTKIIAIDPRLNQTAASYADQWIALKPATDAALADGMAYVIWSEGLADTEFMDRYCIGFDEEHMPEGIPYGESYHSYLFGIKDGIHKTPEWAEKITGVDAEVIRALAREYAAAKPACIQMGLGLQRHGNGEQGSKGVSMLCCMTGNVGISGGSAGGNGSNIAEHHTPALFGHKVENPYPGRIPTFLWTKAIEHGTEMTPREDRIKGMERLDSNIKMIFCLASNTLINQHSDINDTIRILKDDTKCEFILYADIFMTSSARFADLILPATSVFENNNMNTPWTGSNYILRHNKCIDPLFGCRFEWEWICELAERLGISEAFMDGKPNAEDWLRETYNRLREKEPELPDYEVFCERGGWQYREQINHIPFYEEIHDPEHHPFPTPSGKIEIFSKRLYDFNQEDIPAIPRYIPAPRGHEDLLREKYPLQLIGWHTRRRCHSIHDNNEWQDEVEMPSVWMNPKDAAARNIKDGDMVEIFNDLGTVRIPAKITGRVMPGVTAMSQGGWYTPDQNGVDMRGSINVLTSHIPTPLAKGNPQHTNLVEIRVVETGEAL